MSDDPLGLLSDDPLGILDVAPAPVPTIPLHIQRAKAYAHSLPAGKPDKAGLEQRIALAEQGNADENSYLSGMNFPETAPQTAPVMSPTTDTMTPTEPSLVDRISGLNTGPAFRQGAENAGAGLYQQLLKTGVGLGLATPQDLTNAQSQMEVAREHAPAPENILQRGVQSGAEIGTGLAPWMIPGGQLAMPGVVAGARMHDVIERGGSGLEAAGYGGGEGLAMALIPGAAQKLLAPAGRAVGGAAERLGLGARAAGAAESLPAGLAMGAAFPAASAATSQLSGDPERAQQELAGVTESAGIGGLLNAMMSRGRSPRPLDLRPTAEPAPIDVPISEPAPPGVDAYLPPDVIARMKTQPVERNLLAGEPGAPVDPQTLQTSEAQGLQSNGAVVYNKAGEPIPLPGGMAPDRPGASPTVVAEGSPVDPFTMQARPRVDPFPAPEAAPADPTARLAREVADNQERDRLYQNSTPEDPLGILGQEVANTQQAAVRARDIPVDPTQTNTQLDPPVVTASGTPRQRPMELRPQDAVQDRVRRPGEVDPDMQTQEISPDIVAELNRRAAEADRAQYGRQIERLAQRVKGETPEWVAQRKEWGEQAKRDTTPEGRAAAARDDAEIAARGNRPSETATGMDTVPVDESRGAANLFDSEAPAAPLAGWFNDMAAADKMGSTPAARPPVDIAPEARTATEPVNVPVTPGKAKGSDFNRGGFITKGQAAERAQAPESDPNAETRVVEPVNPTEDAVQAHIKSLGAEDAAVARDALKGWNYHAESPKAAVDNLVQVVKMASGRRELNAKKAARVAKAQEKANAGSSTPPEKAREVPAPEVRRPAEPAPSARTEGAGEQPAVRGGDAGETRTSDRPDVERADPVRAELGGEQPAAGEADAVPDALRDRNQTRRGATVDPIDEAGKLVERGVDAVGRTAGRIAEEVSSGEGLLSAPGKALRYYESSLEQRVARKGGEVGKEFASRARKANDRARHLEGQLAPLLRAAHKTIGITKAARAAGRSLEQVEWDGDFGIARSHLVAEGKTEPSPAEAKWQKAYHDLFYASGKQAEDGGMMQMQANGKEIPFKADKGRKEAIRAPDDGLRWLADHPGDADAKKLLAHVAEKNDMKVEDLQKVVATAFGERSLERPAALEQARALKYFPTHMKTEKGDVLPLLRTAPFDMVESLAKRTPTRVAFRETFGNASPIEGVNEYINAGGERRDAEDLFRALSGMPVNPPGTGFKPGSGLDVYSRRLGAFIGMARAASLSVASAVNVPESIAKTLPMVGARTYVKAVKELFRHPRDAAREMENIGAMTAHEFNWHLEPGHKLEQIQRIMSDVLGMPLHVIERTNVTLAALAGYVKAGQLKAGEGTMFDRVRLNWLGFDKGEIDLLMSGKAKPELYQAVATRFPEWTQGHASKPSEQSRMAHNKWVGRLTIAERFPRMTVNRFMRATKSIPELWKQGEKGQAAAATALLAGMGLSHTASGAVGLMVRAALGFQLGSMASSLIQGDDKTRAWKDFLWKSFAGSLFGPASQAVGTLGSNVAGLGDNDQSVASVMMSPIYPLSVVENVTHAARALFKQEPLPGSPFRDLSPADAALKFLNMRLPVTKVASNAAAAAGLGATDPEMDGAQAAFWAWRKKYAPFGGVGAATDYSEFRIAAKKAARMVQGGQDPTPYLEEALKVKMEKGADRNKAFNSLVTSISSRRLMDDLTTEQKQAAADYLGPATIEKIKTYDALLEAWAQRLKEAR